MGKLLHEVVASVEPGTPESQTPLATHCCSQRLNHSAMTHPSKTDLHQLSGIPHWLQQWVDSGLERFSTGLLTLTFWYITSALVLNGAHISWFLPLILSLNSCYMSNYWRIHTRIPLMIWAFVQLTCASASHDVFCFCLFLIHGCLFLNETGDKPLPEPILTLFTDVYMCHQASICLGVFWGSTKEARQ